MEHGIVLSEETLVQQLHMKQKIISTFILDS